MKVLALYLPQFHETPENNEWWGKGFTEWTNVKRAKPLFIGHKQPSIPLEGYYDLSDIEAVNHQADLANRFGVDGFVFFHYWFEGRKLLEKPCEMLLQHPETNIEYCFCWANHSWTRTWDGKDSSILLKQTYGGEEEWKDHIEYFISFFKDPRYIKFDNNPVLFIYNSSVIPNVNDMISSWEHRVKQEGFKGLYIVEYISTKNPKPNIVTSQAVYEDEPLYSLRFETNIFEKLYRITKKKLKRTEFQNCDRIYKMILNKSKIYGGRCIIQGCFPAWDNTPRRGNGGAMVVKNSDPDKFEKCFREMLKCKRKDVSKNFIVINAWNEWGEGAVLEPSLEYGFRYLEAVKNAVENNKYNGEYKS